MESHTPVQGISGTKAGHAIKRTEKKRGRKEGCTHREHDDGCDHAAGCIEDVDDVLSKLAAGPVGGDQRPHELQRHLAGSPQSHEAGVRQVRLNAFVYVVWWRQGG